MTVDESAWITSTDLTAMLAHARGMGLGPGQPFASDRRLRLFAVACCQRWKGFTVADADYAEAHGERCGMTDSQWAQTWCRVYPSYPPAAERADLLREVIGNPWKPVTLDRSWLTPPVLALARSAYEERRGRKCDKCDGKGNTWNHRGKHAAYCSACNRTGRTGDGHLDHGTLAILADALEEAGCVSADLLMHLRGLVVCPRCHGKGRESCPVDAGYNNPLMTRPGWQYCYLCNDYGKGPAAGWWKPREPVVHVRGCWCVDLILGKE